MTTVINGSSNINLDFSTGGRITGDFSNATVANRAMFQTTTVNGVTVIGAIPNGTSTTSASHLYNGVDLTNYSRFSIAALSTEVSLRNEIGGTGTYLPMTFYTGGSERIRVDTSGNVGIGTSSPQARLHANAAVNTTSLLLTPNNAASAADYTQLGFGVGYATSTVYGGIRTAFVNPASTTAVSMQFFTDIGGSNYAERMRIDSSGNLLVGTTSSLSRLTVSSPSNGNGAAYIASSSASDLSNAALVLAKYDNNTTTSQVLVRFIVNNGATASGQINANGASAAAFGSWSDQRLKENIVELPSQLSNIMALRPVEFDYIEAEGGGHQIGFIAQEVQEVYPDLVGERSDGMLTLTDLNKNDARLIKAIQEQQALITQLQADVAALKGN